MKMAQTECSESLAIKLNTLGEKPKRELAYEDGTDRVFRIVGN
jgi:hypothetical protein